MYQKIFYWMLFITSIQACTSTEQIPLPEDGTAMFRTATLAPFYHGVASGDPLKDRVIIWTRVTPEFEGATTVKWAISTEASLANPLHSNTITTDASKDYTVKIDVTDLAPNTTYYYQFEAFGKKSIIGRTKTTASDVIDHVKLAIVSCSNYEAGYYNAFANIAARNDLDAVVHLGDYIYEYGPGTYADTTLGKSRQHLPAKEIIALSDYRTRYAQYRLDVDFQKAHQQHPFITIWDDHEFANNVYQTGAENHQAEEGDFAQRKAAAKQAYFEWLPVRDNTNKDIQRTIRFGNLVDLILLDERVAGRTMPVDSASQANFKAADRSMLGAAQLAWFQNQLKNSTATWKVIGNQVIFSLLDLSWRTPDSPFNLDAWDGYPHEQAQINQFLSDNNISNVIFTTGDTHCSWAFEVPADIAAYKSDASAHTVAVEFGTPSITSANFDESTSIEEVLKAEAIFTNANFNPHLKYVNLRDHGYLSLNIRPEETIAEWHYVMAINKRITTKDTIGKRYIVKSGNHTLNAE